MLAKAKFSSVVITFLKVEVDSTSSKTPKAPKISKFDDCNRDFQKFLLDSIQIMLEKTNFAGRNRQIVRLLLEEALIVGQKKPLKLLRSWLSIQSSILSFMLALLARVNLEKLFFSRQYSTTKK